MIRVVADSNVYVSAIIFGGKPQTVLELAQEGQIELFISDDILAEVTRILRDKFGRSREQLEADVMALDAITTRVQPIERIAAVTADADDNRILECAVAAGSEWHSPRETPPKNLGTTWEQLRPSTGENGGSGPTSKQDESTS